MNDLKIYFCVLKLSLLVMMSYNKVMYLYLNWEIIGKLGLEFLVLECGYIVNM